ncbi:MAG: Spo0E family sporulation regulatory protein-aspartic acid phosphatase [Bacillota bacterium]
MVSSNLKLQDLEKEMESIRLQLNKLIHEHAYDLLHPKVIKLSQCLDKLIVSIFAAKREI